MKLSPRRHDVLTLLSTGASTRDIADKLQISVNTVRAHVQAILIGLGAHSKLEAVAIARARGLVEDDPARAALARIGSVVDGHDSVESKLTAITAELERYHQIVSLTAAR